MESNIETSRISNILVTKNSFCETVIELNKKAIKFGNKGGSKKQSRKEAINTTTYNGTTDRNFDSPEAVKITNFPEDTYKFPSPDVKSWFRKIHKASEAGKPVLVKCLIRYLGGSQRAY